MCQLGGKTFDTETVSNEIFTNISGFVRRRIAESYPNEIFPGRLFLGDYHHASDAHVIETLGITHIVNISDSC